ncbi:hypothetical protein ACXET9_07285 [Brachybacterium sp. DNPG3]
MSTAAHFAAVRALLVGVFPDVKVYDTDASSVASDPSEYPFLVLSGGMPRPFSESLGDCVDGAQGLIRVTHTALAPVAVRELVDISRAALDRVRLTVPGAHGWELRLEDSQDVQADHEVRLNGPETAAYGYFAVDIYRVGSTAL